MYAQTNPVDIRIVSITSTTTEQQLRSLIKAAIAAKSKEEPNASIIGIRLTPSAALEVRDVELGDAYTIALNTTWEAFCVDIADKLTVKNAATVVVQIFYGR